MTPVTCPPEASTASATAPTRPTRVPPYTTPIPRAASARPSSVACCRYSGREPGLEPAKTQTLLMSIPLTLFQEASWARGPQKHYLSPSFTNTVGGAPFFFT